MTIPPKPTPDEMRQFLADQKRKRKALQQARGMK